LFLVNICNAVAFSKKMTPPSPKGAIATSGVRVPVPRVPWHEDNTIYADEGPENKEVRRLIEEGDGCVRIFGYGSLCWNPGADGGLSKASQTLGRVRGYKRVWAQKSTDHRGTHDFRGVVCTLLTEDEYYSVLDNSGGTVGTFLSSSVSIDSTSSRITSTSDNDNDNDNDNDSTSSNNNDKTASVHTTKAEKFDKDMVTEGVIFCVPPELVYETLAELDFREKEGYARNVCEVVEEGSNKTYKALIYRGTPDNPVFSSRRLVDFPLCAAIMSVAIGPSGANDVYLNNLDVFLKKIQNFATQHDDTTILAEMVRCFQNNYQLYFLSGGGSNQHNQLLLNRPEIPSLIVAEDAHLRTEIVLPTPLAPTEDRDRSPSSLHNPPKAIFAGGGHSALLTKSGRLFLWGWNDDLQCGAESKSESTAIADRTRARATAPTDPQPLPFVEPLQDIAVETAALGFSHTLVVEKQTGRLYAFGSDERGQVTGRRNVPLSDVAQSPRTPVFLEHEEVAIVGAGLFHSAVVTKRGDLITFGCDRFGQSNLPKRDGMDNTHGCNDKEDHCRWKPVDADRIVDVSCGRRHTVAVDSLNRIWTFGENKHGQLGRKTQQKKGCGPSLVNTEGKIEKDDTVRVYCGWSHTIIHVRGASNGRNKFFGFGRNDKGQLGNGSNTHADGPIELFSDQKIKSVRCGSESTMAIDDEGQVWGCGWNEHGNLGTGNQEDAFHLSRNRGAETCTPPDVQNSEIALAVGGAHYIVAAVQP